jgi:hypothetical protein
MECQAEGYPARTRQNVETSDGTLLIGQSGTGGSKLTYQIATEIKKPIFLAACSRPPEIQHDPQRIEEFRYWLDRYQIGILNVAGNRESETPGIAEFTRTFLLNALRGE